MINEAIDLYLKNFSTYHRKDWYWVINPNTKEWVANVADGGYTFYNKDFWDTFFGFYPSDELTENIRKWVIYKLGVSESRHCYPDYLVGEYDWKNEFNETIIDEVIEFGELIF